MTYKGHIMNGVVVFDEPAPLADGTRVHVEVASRAPHGRADERSCEAGTEQGPTLAERLANIIGKAEGLPEDWSENHDNYLREDHSHVFMPPTYRSSED